MQFKAPKDDEHFIWTKHVVEKMRYYRLSESRIRRLMKNYDRKEQGIAPGTIALGKQVGTKRKTEIWLMYQSVPSHFASPFCHSASRKDKERKDKNRASLEKSGKVKIISVWRYPGISPKREGAPIPENIIKELQYAYEQHG